MLKTICYISDSIQYESLKNLENLYLKASANNFRKSITGILIYTNNNFLQVLEGEENVVNETFKIISLDIRHRNIFKIIDTTIEERIFEDYNFGFTTINKKKELDELYEYLDWLRNADSVNANKIITMVESFIVRKEQP